MIEIDHVFLVVSCQELQISRMEEAGFRESYRRTHPGQGTQNVCYCFDNLFVELLWVHDIGEACSAVIERTQLLARATDSKACPFGIAYRGGGLKAPSWPYSPPYLPDGIVIQIACDSDDLEQPLIFRSPGNHAPSSMPVEKRGSLQREIGITKVTRLEYSFPQCTPISNSLRELAEATILELNFADSFSMKLTFERVNGTVDNLCLTPE